MRPPPPISSLPRYPITGGTILLAIGVTAAYWAKVDISPLLEDVNVRRWQLWRFLTSALPHVDPFHLIFNIYWTWVFGTLVESALGHFKTLMIFALFAIVSGAAEFALFEGGVGLSGVGYGLFGMLWILSRRDERFEDAVDTRTIALFVGWFFLCIALTEVRTMPIANVAHAVGAVTGVLLGFAIAPRKTVRPLATLGLSLLIIISLAGATIFRPWVNFSKTAYAGEYKLAYDLLQAEKIEEAARWLQDVVRMKPSEAGAWFNLAIAHSRLGHADEARACYEKAYHLDPNDKSYREMWEWYQQADQAKSSSRN